MGSNTDLRQPLMSNATNPLGNLGAPASQPPPIAPEFEHLLDPKNIAASSGGLLGGSAPQIGHTASMIDGGGGMPGLEPQQGSGSAGGSRDATLSAGVSEPPMNQPLSPSRRTHSVPVDIFSSNQPPSFAQRQRDASDLMRSLFSGTDTLEEGGFSPRLAPTAAPILQGPPEMMLPQQAAPPLSTSPTAEDFMPEGGGSLPKTPYIETAELGFDLAADPDDFSAGLRTCMHNPVDRE